MTAFALVNTVTNTIVLVEPAVIPTKIVNTKWVECPDGTTPHNSTFDGTNFHPVPVAAPAAPTVWPILKSTLRTRLTAIGLEAAADAARAALPAAQQAQWAEALFIASNDPAVLAFLAAIGCSSAQITAVMAADAAASAVFGKAISLPSS